MSKILKLSVVWEQHAKTILVNITEISFQFLSTHEGVMLRCQELDSDIIHNFCVFFLLWLKLSEVKQGDIFSCEWVEEHDKFKIREVDRVIIT